MAVNRNNLKVVYKSVDELIPYVNNARTHSDEQVTQIASSIKEFGFNNPILTDGDNGVIAGHGRLLAAKKLKLEKVPVIELSGLSESQKKAYILADNKIALNSGWDLDMLSIELKDIKMEGGISLDSIGFTEVELENFLMPEDSELNEQTDEEIDERISEALTINPISKIGTVWVCGIHKVACLDSTNSTDLKLLGENWDLLLTDPPYGINVVNKTERVGAGGALHFEGKLGDKNKVQSRKYLPVKNDETIETAQKAIEISKLITKNQIIFGGNYFTEFLPPSRCWLVWDKVNTGHFADCELAWTSFDTSVRKFEWMWNGLARSSKRDEEGRVRIHPTQKPVGLISQIIEKYAKPNETVLDLFGGSGSTLIACEKLNHPCSIVEIEPAYVDLIVKRWQDYTGEKAIRQSDGMEYDELCQNKK